MVEEDTTHLVSSRFDIDEDILAEKADESDYWQNAYDFFLDVKNEHIDDMSVSQMNWLKRIEDKLSGQDEYCLY